MTPAEFKQFCHLLCGEQTATDEGGYYPQMPFNGRFASQWYRALERYPFKLCQRALEIHAAASHDRYPTLDALVERVKALQPPPTQPWQQFQPAQHQAMRDQGYGGVLRSLLPEPGSSAWAKCWCWLFEMGLAKPGREVEMAAECRRFADEYPADAADWLRHAARLYSEAGEHDTVAVPASVGRLEQIGTARKTNALPAIVPDIWREHDEDGEVF